MTETKKITLTAILTALSVAFSYVIHLAGGMSLGQVLLPLHFIVLLIGVLCGIKYGVISGILLPFINFLLNGRPTFPTNLLMSVELAVYGGVIGIFRNKLPLLISLLIAMVTGRIINLFSNLILFQMQDSKFAFNVFFTNNFINGVLGIVMQLVFIPIIIYALVQAKLIEGNDIRLWKALPNKKE